MIVRLLLGLVFFVFGLTAFLQFLKGPLPGGLAGQFLQALFQSHYALTILAPVIVNILLYHLLLNHEGIGGALIVAVFWFVLFFRIARTFPGCSAQRLRLCHDGQRLQFAPGCAAPGDSR